jgi:imidazolonepropionase-like amidohydrolase
VRFFLSVARLSGIVCLGGIGASRLAAQAVVISNVNVVAVDRGVIVAEQAVVIEGNRITAVGPSRSLRQPRGARIIDGANHYLIPGLWDMHVHAVTPWFGETFLPVLVANGVTGVRDLFTTTEAVLGWRKKIESGEAVGPRTGTFGSLVDGDPPIWGAGSIVARSPAEGRRIVDSLEAAQVGFVKVYSRLDPETFTAIAQRARQIGIPFGGHIPTLVPAVEAARLGQRTVEHLTQIAMGCSGNEETLVAQARAAVQSPRRWDSLGPLSRGRLVAVLESQDQAKCDQLADAFKAAGTYFVPTTTVLRSISRLDDPALAQDPRLEYIPTFLKTGWDPTADFRFRMLTAEDWKIRKRQYARELELLRLFHRRGVKFLAGTDLANPYIFPGFSLHDELGLLVSIGMTPLEALRAATLEPARFLEASDSMGTVAKGRLADLVLLRANPLADIEAVRSIEVVVANGRVFDRAALDRLLEEAVARAARGPR